VKRIRENRAFAQSCLLARILNALTYSQGEFRRAEATAFDAETFALVLAPMEARASGKPPHAQWRDAVEGARAAERAAGP